ncbi:MAG TPA: hypothetical protein VMC43_02710 [Candidatus Paceibacterota bacterium]|nr:hypothetical protein [Candidatus Paceibacterota bacterium]
MSHPLFSPAAREAFFYVGVSAGTAVLGLFLLFVVGALTLIRVFVRNKVEPTFNDDRPPPDQVDEFDDPSCGGRP